MAIDYGNIISRCKDRLFFYSPYRFIQGYDRDTIFVRTVLSPWLDKIQRGAITVQQVLVDDVAHYVVVEPLAWDTQYFGFPVYKIHTILYTHHDYSLLVRALRQWISGISSQVGSYYIADLPSEDVYLIQAFCDCRYRLTETRLHYVLSDVGSYSRERYPVRRATQDDIDNLRKVAVHMRNPYDRLHADISLKQEVADAYLAIYIENSVRGFADLVLVPAEGDGPPDGFHTCSIYPERILEKRIAKFGIVAVSKETRKGWHYKLLSETLHFLDDNEVNYVLVNTQASNRAVNRVLPSFGFTLAFVTHIFSKSFESCSNP
jgi:dTDP-4-amino-4,6-dideoxy-D-galactose acyltransferase